MPITVRDVEDALLDGKQKAAEWQAEFEMEFFRPNRELEMARLWQGLNPEVKRQLSVMIPDSVADVERKFGGGYGNRR